MESMRRVLCDRLMMMLGSSEFGKVVAAAPMSAFLCT